LSEPLGAPRPLAPDDDLDSFSCGVVPLDDWLRLRARRNEAEGASRTFVCCAGKILAGYYSLAASSVLREAATGAVRRNMPEPVPAVLIGRLAIDTQWQGNRLGIGLLHDAVLRIVAAAETIGVRAILVHAISEGVKAFYGKHGFRASPLDPLTLMMTVEEAKRMMGR
jgi:predicted N-acetyltransferase YhbS